MSFRTDLLGIQEIALLAHVTSAAVANWRSRFKDFPRPVADLAGGPVFDAAQVKAWIRSRGTDGGSVGEKELSCFVIGPIGDEHAPVGAPERVRFEQALETWAKVIEPACVAAGLNPTRADKIARPGEITLQVFTLIRDADVVVADVTGANPNVMYELGLRHTLNSCTIQIGEHGQLPFDISAIRTLKFVRTPMGLVDGRKNLQVLLEAAIRGEFDPVSATRIWNPAAAEALSTEPEPRVEGDEGPGFLELLSEMELALPELTELIERAGKVMTTMGTLATNATAELEKSDGMKAGFAGRLRITDKFATQLSPIADELETLASGFETKVGSIDAGMTCLLDIVEQDPSQLKEMESFSEVLQPFVESIRQANGHQSDFVAALAVPGKFSKLMRIVTRRIADSVSRMRNALARAEVWNSRLQRLVAQAKRPSAS